MGDAQGSFALATVAVLGALPEKKVKGLGPCIGVLIGDGCVRIFLESKWS